MKFSEFLLETGESADKVKNSQTNRTKEYVLHNIFLRERNAPFKKAFDAFNSTYSGVFPAINFLMSYKDYSANDRNYFLKEIFASDLIAGKNATFRGDLWISHYDVLGDPPFNIKECDDFTFRGNQNRKLKTVPIWFPTEADTISIDNSSITSLHNIDKVITKCRQLQFTGNGNDYLKDSLLGLLKIKNLEYTTLPLKVAHIDVQNIINKFLPNKRGNEAIFECQQLLLDAGFDDFAQL